jgi:hypothetical protein
MQIRHERKIRTKRAQRDAKYREVCAMTSNKQNIACSHTHAPFEHEFVIAARGPLRVRVRLLVVRRAGAGRAALVSRDRGGQTLRRNEVRKDEVREVETT